jgi:hypothetical protein
VPLEKAEQAAIVDLVRKTGGKAYILGNTRRKGDYPGTMQTPGIADLWLELGAVVRRQDALLPVGLWWEVKAQAGRVRPEQLEFEASCQRTGTPYGRGTCNDFIAWLVAQGRLRPDQVPYYRRPGYAPDEGLHVSE